MVAKYNKHFSEKVLCNPKFNLSSSFHSFFNQKKQQSTIIISAVCCFGSCSGSKNEPDGQLYSTLVCDLICIRPSS